VNGEIVILSEACRSFIARGAVEEPYGLLGLPMLDAIFSHAIE